MTAPSSMAKTSDVADSVVSGEYKIKWMVSKEYKLVFLVVYQQILQLTYIDALLFEFKQQFCDTFSQSLKNTSDLHDYSEFEENFEDLRVDIEEKANEEKKRKVPRTYQETQKPQEQQPIEEMVQSSPEIKPAKGRGKFQKGVKYSPEIESKKPKKGGREWVNGVARTKSDQILDYSDPSEKESTEKPSGIIAVKASDTLYDAPEMQSQSRPQTTSTQSKLYSYFSSYITGKSLTSEDLDPILSKLREQLIAKNVASDIALHITTSLQTNLIGVKVSSFESAFKVVKNELSNQLKTILTPQTSIEVLRDVILKRDKKQVYSFVFVGVNGVGKSTNLSKVAYLLLRNRVSVLIAACDTFRAGAVEQLRVHARNLGACVEGARVELFERGYGSDAAGIAKDAIKYAGMNGFDVVLIDTAGRMQDNEPLMRALAKLVSVNNPDKILFVGEALVGNEAVDQLVKFNQALKDFSGLQVPRQIDGIILTKFDTIDDKVGAALSMTYITKQPILFTGVGQTYEDLRRLNVVDIVEKLLD